MKKFYTIFLGAVFSLLAVSCFPETEQDNWTPGEAEDAFCYGVYFPVQEASGYHIYSPTEAPKVVITVSRTNTSGAITVPVEASFSEEGIFEATPIAFADGQAETTFTLNFPTAKEGVEYAASFVITDNAYVSKYSSNPIAFDFSFMKVKMEDFMTEDGKNKAKVTFTDNTFWGEVHDDIYIQFYEVDGIRYCTTTGGKLLSPLDGGTEGEGPWGTGCQLSFKWYTKNKVEVDGEEYDFIEVAPQYMGYDYQGSTPVYCGDRWNQLNAMGSSGIGDSSYGFFTSIADQLPCYYDGHGGFVFNMAYWLFGTTSWFGFKNDAPVGIAEGYLRVDYSLDIESDYPSDGVTPIYVEAGADVKSVKYAVYEGALNSAQLDAKLSGIIDGKEEVETFTEFTFDEEEAVNYATIGLSPEKTATYTLIMVACDADGKVQNNASLTFNHVNATDNDDYAVEVNAFTEDTPARYAELHAYDSFAYCVYGKDLTEVHTAIFSAATVSKYGTDYILEVVKSTSDYAVEEDVLAQINADGGYYTIAKGVDPKTTYYVIVWATNGSRDDFAIASYTTDPLPYVWNSLGKGTLTDGFSVELFGKPDFTVECDVYEEATAPGLYMINNYQLAHVCQFFGQPESVMANYKGGNWDDTDLVIDATDPAKVVIEEQNFGVCVNSAYGFFYIRSNKPGKLENGEITFPASGLDCYLDGYGWLAVNEAGTFKITLPAAPAVPALTASSNVVVPFAIGEAVVSDNISVVSTNPRYFTNEVYERDAQPVNVKAQTLAPARKEKAANVKANMTVSKAK